MLLPASHQARKSSFYRIQAFYDREWRIRGDPAMTHALLAYTISELAIPSIEPGTGEHPGSPNRSKPG